MSYLEKQYLILKRRQYIKELNTKLEELDKVVSKFCSSNDFAELPEFKTKFLQQILGETLGSENKSATEKGYEETFFGFRQLNEFTGKIFNLFK